MGRRARRDGRWVLGLSLVAGLLVGPGCGFAPFSWFRGGRSGEEAVSEGSAHTVPQATAGSDSASIGAVARAAALEASGERAAAEACLAAALAENPDDVAALSLQSKLDWGGGRHAEAVERLAHARGRIDPFPEDLAAALALHLAALGRAAESASAAAPLESQGTDWGRFGSTLVYTRLRGEGFASAGDAARRAEAANPASAANHNNLGVALLYEGKPDSARAELLRANAIDPELPGPLYNLAIVEKFYFRDDAAARGWYQRYRVHASDDPDGVGAALGEGSSAEPVATRHPEGP